MDEVKEMGVSNTPVRVIVLSAFRDKDDFAKVYEAGSEVEFPVERAEHLKTLGLVAFDSEGGVCNTPQHAIDLSQASALIISNVKACERVDDLEKALIAEINGKNRKSVADALQSRIAVLKQVE